MGAEFVALLSMIVPLSLFALIWIIALVAVWRGMKALESIAESQRRIAEK
jgi:hypothetical protein